MRGCVFVRGWGGVQRAQSTFGPAHSAGLCSEAAVPSLASPSITTLNSFVLLYSIICTYLLKYYCSSSSLCLTVLYVVILKVDSGLLNVVTLRFFLRIFSMNISYPVKMLSQGSVLVLCHVVLMFAAATAQQSRSQTSRIS